MPRLFLLGGSGRTGGHIIDYALSKGHTLTALVRDPAKLTRRAGLTAVRGTPMNRRDVDGAIDGADAVIVALNSTRRSDTPWARPVSPPRLMADSVANATAAMTARGIRRIVVVSAFGAGDSLSRQPLLTRWMITRTNLRDSTPGRWSAVFRVFSVLSCRFTPMVVARGCTCWVRRVQRVRHAASPCRRIRRKRRGAGGEERPVLGDYAVTTPM